MPQIRPIVISIIQHGGKILVFEGWDDCDQAYFYRPLGGGIEFGETGQQAIEREMLEEIGAKLTGVRYLFTIENIFRCNGMIGHEIVLAFEAELTDPRLYQLGRIEGHEASGQPLLALWKKLRDFETGEAVLVPEGLLERLLNQP